MNDKQAKRFDYAEAYAMFNIPVNQEPRWDQNPENFRKIELLTESNVSYSANSSSIQFKSA